MEKGETKNKKPVTKTVKKAPAKKAAVAKKAPVKKVAAPKKVAVKVEPTIKEEINKMECKHCHHHFAEGLTICPHCRRRQNDRTGIMVISVLALVLLFSIIATHFVDKYYTENVNESDYKFGCKLASFEELVRNPKNLRNEDVKLIGRVLNVEGTDLSYGNLMTVEMDINLFEGAGEQKVIFEYLDKDYEIGLLENDIITIYGTYNSINGNTPFIKARFIVFGT